MIVYDQAKWYGYHKLIQMRGSVLPRTFPRCIVASLAVLVIDYYDMIYFPRSPYAHQVTFPPFFAPRWWLPSSSVLCYQVFTFGLSFLVIMRTTAAIQVEAADEQRGQQQPSRCMPPEWGQQKGQEQPFRWRRQLEERQQRSSCNSWRQQKRR